MTVYLLDANVLIAIIDTKHTHHRVATEWFEAHRLSGWATCPLTENAALRIIGNPRYRNSLQTPAAVIPYLRDLVGLPAHVFWPDDISFLDDEAIVGHPIMRHGDITDRYLVALAAAHNGVLATFDRAISGTATPHLEVIDT